MKKLLVFCALLLITVFSGCSDDEEDLGGGLNTSDVYIWDILEYTKYSAEMVGELLGKDEYVYANTGDDGIYHGELYRYPQYMYIIKIIDNSTLIKDECRVYTFDRYYGNGRVIHSILSSPRLCYITSENPVYYSYVRVDDKLILSNGEIYIIQGNKLYSSGSSTPYTQFKPEQ